jgi:hypothetical protein
LRGQQLNAYNGSVGNEKLSLGKLLDSNTMMEPLAPPAAWLCWQSIPNPWELLWKGLAKAAVEGI